MMVTFLASSWGTTSAVLSSARGTWGRSVEVLCAWESEHSFLDDLLAMSTRLLLLSRNGSRCQISQDTEEVGGSILKSGLLISQLANTAGPFQYGSLRRM